MATFKEVLQQAAGYRIPKQREVENRSSKQGGGLPYEGYDLNNWNLWYIGLPSSLRTTDYREHITPGKLDRSLLIPKIADTGSILGSILVGNEIHRHLDLLHQQPDILQNLIPISAVVLSKYLYNIAANAYLNKKHGI